MYQKYSVVDSQYHCPQLATVNLCLPTSLSNEEAAFNSYQKRYN